MANSMIMTINALKWSDDNVQGRIMVCKIVIEERAKKERQENKGFTVISEYGNAFGCWLACRPSS